MKGRRKIIWPILVVILLAVVLLAYGWNRGEDMTFWVIGEDRTFYLYHLDDEMNAELILNADYVAYGNDSAVYLQADGFRWTLYALRLGDTSPVLLAEGDSLKTNPVGFRIQIQDGYAYIPVRVMDETKSVTDTYLLECALNGSECRELYGLELDIWYNFHVQDGKVYYVEMIESDEDRIMSYDLKTEKLACLGELDVVSFTGGSYLDQGVLWRITKEGDLSEPDSEFTAYATGFSLKDGTKTNLLLNDYRTTDDTNFWVNDGFVYCFRDRRLSEDEKSGIVADLWKINAATGAETCIRMELPYDNNFPPDIFFGKEGLILSDEELDGERYVATLKYISYDGSELVELDIPENLEG